MLLHFDINNSIVITTDHMRKQEQIPNNEEPRTKYFEKQGSFSLQCGMHCINNLFRQQVYTVKDMEDICFSLSDDFINPHKHVLGGDYDANVIIMALQNKGCECQWIDKRKEIEVGKYIRNEDTRKQFMGFLVNMPMPKKLYHKILRFSSRHWVSIRLIPNGKEFQLCDSLEEQTKLLQSEDQVQKYLKNAIKNEGQIFWVFKNQQK